MLAQLGDKHGAIEALRELVAKLKADDPYISGIRAGQFAPGVVRLVLDLKQPVLPQVFTLPPIAAYQHRLVFDLYPTQPADPLEALIAERMRDSRSGATAPTPAAPAAPVDPLGELIARQTTRPAPPTGQPNAPVLIAPDADSARVTARNGTAGGSTDRLIIVALDPGHGGEDPGAIGPAGTREKDVVLRVAHLLRDRLAFSTQAMILWCGVLIMSFMGFLDDYIKITKAHNRGIFWKRKSWITLSLAIGVYSLGITAGIGTPSPA